jgi:hypothetical protein
MPPLGLHMTIARELALELNSTLIDADRGAYYLGATTPDIRILTKWDRAQTHFFNLDDFEEQHGAHRLFEQEPGLRDPSMLNPATASFVAGYVSHLELDESYICEIYRPSFGERSVMRDEIMSNVMDRLLQFELDRKDREDDEKIAEIQRAIAESAVEVSVGFIARDTLLEWRKIAVDVLSHPPTWDRFTRMASRHLSAVGVEGEEQVSKFMQDVPNLLQRTFEHVGEERVREYLHGAKSRALQTMKEYLS